MTDHMTNHMTDHMTEPTGARTLRNPVRGLSSLPLCSRDSVDGLSSLSLKLSPVLLIFSRTSSIELLRLWPRLLDRGSGGGCCDDTEESP